MRVASSFVMTEACLVFLTMLSCLLGDTPLPAIFSITGIVVFLIYVGWLLTQVSFRKKELIAWCQNCGQRKAIDTNTSYDLGETVCYGCSAHVWQQFAEEWKGKRNAKRD